MDFLKAFTNPFLLIPIISWAIAQILKTVINAIMNKKVELSRLVGDGGMPSGHSATVTSLAALCGLKAGFGSAHFAIAAILAVIVMHDALGVRRETGKQAVSIIKISELLNDYFSEQDTNLKTDKLKVLVGHTPLQVLCGAVLGIIVAVIYWLIAVG
ncbi:MAG: divergent PAP2 family protein [Ruminococcaceae bacterium]|nr:divergent PAP2 family protein [Oscillospiraceae bacterium]